MLRRTNKLAVFTLCVGFAVSALPADDKADKKPKKPKPKNSAAVKPEQADADFAVQGEYSGEIIEDEEKVKLGVQIVALGDGKFRAVAYPGGLPGDGWNGKEKIRAEGQTKDGMTRFVGKKGTGTVKDGQLSIKNPDGKDVGKLKKVTRKSPTLGAKPATGAVVLFDGTTPKNFKGGRMTKDGLLMQGVTSHKTFQSFKLHMEFMLSYMPYARGQGRSNSGCYMQGRYEVQILDSFGLEGKHNECGGLYETRDPAVNMCYPPLSWQTYDVDFVAAKYDDDGKKIKNARMTVRHNGVVVHKDVELPKGTRASPVKEGPKPGPIYIQNHGNPLRFRNIWVVETRS